MNELVSFQILLDVEDLRLVKREADSKNIPVDGAVRTAIREWLERQANG